MTRLANVGTDPAGFELPSRKEYIRRQRDARGRRIFGILPGHYPRELLWGLDILPVEIWDPPVGTLRADGHLQPYICPVAKGALELLMESKALGLDALLFPHLCDALQNLASLTAHYLKPGLPVHFFYAPKSERTKAAEKYYTAQLRALVRQLQETCGPLDPDRLQNHLSQGRKLDRELRDLYSARSRGELRASNQVFYRVVRSAEYLHPDDLLPVLARFRDACAGRRDEGPGVVLSGILPNPPAILGTLDGLGIRVLDDDLLCCGRRIPAETPAVADPFGQLAERYFALPPCSTGAAPIEIRVARLLRMVEESGARGVIFWSVKFCEPEAFDLPQIREALRAEGLPCLVLETALNEKLAGQAATRLEAFCEMLD